jgi:hypothetical protein
MCYAVWLGGVSLTASVHGHGMLLALQVLCCLALLINVLGPSSPQTYQLLLPLLREALHPDSSQPELLEDGLGLWLVALRNAPSSEAGAPLLELTPALTACLTNSTGKQRSVFIMHRSRFMQ